MYLHIYGINIQYIKKKKNQDYNNNDNNVDV